ncbi:MotA/TolQ/ExbB proton channel family protein [bacterium]|nr:MotA/TolQ/ExbB proton channel family protein [bacterium]
MSQGDVQQMKEWSVKRPGIASLVGILLLWTAMNPSLHPACAQESPPPPADQAPPAETLPPPPASEPPVPAADPSVVNPPVPSAPSSTEDPLPQQGSFLRYCWDASPTFFVLMTLISVIMVYLAVTSLVRLQLPRLIPPTFAASLDDLLAERKYKEAYELVKKDESPLGRILQSGLDRLGQGYERSIEAMLGASDEFRMKLDQSVSSINVIAAVAPMLGLLGTVLGMIFAFQKIGLGTQIKPALLAQDIGLALVSTLEGLVIAIPAIVIFSYLRNRIATLMGTVESTAESYLTRFSAAIKK